MSTGKRILLAVILVGVVPVILGFFFWSDWKDWQPVMERDTTEAYEVFLSNNPHSTFAGRARRRLDELVWKVVTRENTIAAYQEYLLTYPKGAFRSEAYDKVLGLEWRFANERNTIPAYKEFVRRYSGTALAEEAETRIAKLKTSEAADWRRVRQFGGPADLRDFLERYPGSSHAEEAREKLMELDWQAALQKDTEDAYREFQRTYPKSGFLTTITGTIEQAMIGMTMSLFDPLGGLNPSLGQPDCVSLDLVEYPDRDFTIDLVKAVDDGLVTEERDGALTTCRVTNCEGWRLEMLCIKEDDNYQIVSMVRVR
jgi:hypothetical protein